MNTRRDFFQTAAATGLAAAVPAAAAPLLPLVKFGKTDITRLIMFMGGQNLPFQWYIPRL